DDTAMWLVLLLSSTMIVPLARWSSGQRGLHMALTVTALNLVVFINLALLQGDSSYVSRSLYFAPVPIAAVFGTAIASLLSKAPQRFPEEKAAAVLTGLLIMTYVGLSGVDALVNRIHTLIPYYKVDDQRQ